MKVAYTIIREILIFLKHNEMFSIQFIFLKNILGPVYYIVNIYKMFSKMPLEY